LNSLVEQYLLFFSTDFTEEIAFFRNSNLKRSRSQSASILLSKYGLNISNLSGFLDVNELKEIVNGLKHRGGFDFTDFSSSIPVFKTISDDTDTLKRLYQGVEQFLKALTQKNFGSCGNRVI